MRHLVLLLVLAAGCANVTTTKIVRTADGALAINSGKDVVIGSLRYTTPQGEALEVHGYSSSVNVNAITAESAREQSQMQMVLELVSKAIQLGVAGAKTGLGIP